MDVVHNIICTTRDITNCEANANLNHNSTTSPKGLTNFWQGRRSVIVYYILNLILTHTGKSSLTPIMKLLFTVTKASQKTIAVHNAEAEVNQSWAVQPHRIYLYLSSYIYGSGKIRWAGWWGESVRARGPGSQQWNNFPLNKLDWNKENTSQIYILIWKGKIFSASYL